MKKVSIVVLAAILLVSCGPRAGLSKTEIQQYKETVAWHGAAHGSAIRCKLDEADEYKNRYYKLTIKSLGLGDSYNAFRVFSYASSEAEKLNTPLDCELVKETTKTMIKLFNKEIERIKSL